MYYNNVLNPTKYFSDKIRVWYERVTNKLFFPQEHCCTKIIGHASFSPLTRSEKRVFFFFCCTIRHRCVYIYKKINKQIKYDREKKTTTLFFGYFNRASVLSVWFSFFSPVPSTRIFFRLIKFSPVYRCRVIFIFFFYIYIYIYFFCRFPLYAHHQSPLSPSRSVSITIKARYIFTSYTYNFNARAGGETAGTAAAAASAAIHYSFAIDTRDSCKTGALHTYTY